MSSLYLATYCIFILWYNIIFISWYTNLRVYSTVHCITVFALYMLQWTQVLLLNLIHCSNLAKGHFIKPGSPLLFWNCFCLQKLVRLCVVLCVYVSVRRALINSGMIWYDIDPVWLVKLNIILAIDKVDGCVL